ncbi:MAG: hypothetical protein Q4F95_04025 [Oscillospiraceae bacterium]|nr:hypothetical protein [Oscillospiraceae bacterium]
MEIGSEFWFDKIPVKEDKEIKVPDFFSFGEDNRLLFLGRTALDAALADIMKNRTVRVVYCPSYCCQSMLEPFISRNIKIRYYSVNLKNNKISINVDTRMGCDVFLAVNYFGFGCSEMTSYIEAFRRRGTAVIEDITHNLLSTKAYCKDSDYLIAGLRKWGSMVGGGLLCKMHGKFSEDLKFVPPDVSLVRTRLSAMVAKGHYMRNPSSKVKSFYTSQYWHFNSAIIKNYANYTTDLYSARIINNMNIELMRSRRLSNVKVLYSELSDTAHLKLIGSLSEGDCPLYVPVSVDPELRTGLRESLKGQEIFLPIHWDKPNEECVSNLYDTELSLVCDQRYEPVHIRNMAYAVKKYLNSI